MVEKYLAHEYTEGKLSRVVRIADDDNLEKYIKFYKEDIYPNSDTVSVERDKDLGTVHISGLKHRDKDFSRVVRLDHKFMD